MARSENFSKARKILDAKIIIVSMNCHSFGGLRFLKSVRARHIETWRNSKVTQERLNIGSYTSSLSFDKHASDNVKFYFNQFARASKLQLYLLVHSFKHIIKCTMEYKSSNQLIL